MILKLSYNNWKKTSNEFLKNIFGIITLFCILNLINKKFNFGLIKAIKLYTYCYLMEHKKHKDMDEIYVIIVNYKFRNFLKNNLYKEMPLFYYQNNFIYLNEYLNKHYIVEINYLNKKCKIFNNVRNIICDSYDINVKEIIGD